MQASIQELMARTGVRFGTSGARGLAVEMSDLVCYAYTLGFLQYVESAGELGKSDSPVAVAGDLRPSSERIMEAVMRAIEAKGCRPVNCGRIPSPALALYGLAERIPAIMVTGSHIPADRNGIKFNKPAGEVLKSDEAGICEQVVTFDDRLFDAAGQFIAKPAGQRSENAEAEASYLRRYVDGLPANALHGARLGVYQHSAVGRDLTGQILRALGAEITRLGRSETFVPVDTEAVRPEDMQLARQWAAAHCFDAIVSTDGDGDRPLISDDRGEWLRGDVVGVLCARLLEADSVSVPISCSTLVERCGFFPQVRRTRIGSPYVIAAMMEASAQGGQRVVGFEANGGFLTNSALSLGGAALRALPTRDAMLPLLAVLLLARQEGRTISQLAAALPARFTASGLLRECPPACSQAILKRFSCGDEAADKRQLAAVFSFLASTPVEIDRTDGVRVTFSNGETLHLRPSGNAPEFRCYTEASAPQRAQELNLAALEVLACLRAGLG
jgi:phosphomannomutase